DVPRHRVHRGARALRVRARLHPQVSPSNRFQELTMRVRRLIVAGCLTFATVGAMAGVAHAAPAGKFEKGCVEKLGNGASDDDCQAAPSPLKPENSELVWGSISFVLLLGIFWKFGYPAVTKAMKGREDRIRGDLEQAEGAKTEAEGVLAQYRAQLADARTEAG